MIGDTQTRVYRKAGVLLPQSQQESGEFHNRVTPQLGPATTAGRYVQMAGGSIFTPSCQELPQDQTIQGI